MSKSLQDCKAKDNAATERILPHLGFWHQGVRVIPGTDPPGDWVIEPCVDDAQERRGKKIK
ncbi:MAG: hypothetical protein ACOYOU_13805 [Kiritimatiellia bacterium]